MEFGDLTPATLRFDGVLFDLYGTLVSMGKAGVRSNSLRAMADALRVDPTAFARRWAESFDDRARGRFGTLEETLARLAADLGRAPGRAEVQAAARARLEFSRALLRSDPVVLQTLDDLRTAGCRLAIVSDATDETPRLWPTTELAPRFDATVFSCLEGLRKPDPEIYRLALQRLRLDAARCAYVGDGGSRELSGATKVGLTAFRYCFPDADQDPVDRVDPDVEWSGPDLRDLRGLLRPG
jgi:putative hydrolase of the HAD superfamily